MISVGPFGKLAQVSAACLRLDLACPDVDLVALEPGVGCFQFGSIQFRDLLFQARQAAHFSALDVAGTAEALTR